MKPVENLHIKISGCFNSCGQHHVADLGFYGVSRKVGGYAVPHFQVVLGGEWEHNGGFVRPAGGGDSVEEYSAGGDAPDGALCERAHGSGETLQGFRQAHRQSGNEEHARGSDQAARRSDRSLVFQRLGRSARIHAGRYGRGRMRGRSGVPVEFDLAAAEREVFEAQVALENGPDRKGAEDCVSSDGARGEGAGEDRTSGISDDPDQIVSEFRTRFYDTQKFWDPFAGGKFANYLVRRAPESGSGLYGGFHPLSDRRSAAFHRRGAQLLQQTGHGGRRVRPRMSSPIQLQHVNVKLLAGDPADVDLEPLIPIFHDWIRDRVFEELLLDVADYRHVPEGPGRDGDRPSGELQRGQHRRPAGSALQPQGGARRNESEPVAAGGARGADGLSASGGRAAH